MSQVLTLKSHWFLLTMSAKINGFVLDSFKLDKETTPKSLSLSKFVPKLCTGINVTIFPNRNILNVFTFDLITLRELKTV